MNISIKMEYDNGDQYFDTGGLIKYLAKHIKNNGKKKINVFIENNTLPTDYIIHDPNRIIIPTIIISNDSNKKIRQLKGVVIR